ncbi:MAG TPA: hypothetical protein VGR06_08590 [Actinophytocola sp.]|jgi:hypothetical protein|uniref:hypothetical protein n=1 Tax=Actinophytocola sp. TaxID=1872138 RepID=UPI002DFBC23F|nr:hypothetical protein [Actinophytocola sp.]
MTRNRAVVDLDALTALFPHRVARATELIALGLTGTTIYNRCRPNGPWQRLAPGIVLLGADPPTRTQRIASALRHAGTGAILTGWDALTRHGMSAPTGTLPVHLLVPHHRQVRGDRDLVIERTTIPPNPLLYNGFPITPLPRATIDTARRLTSPDTTRTLLTEVVRRGRVSPSLLHHELDTGTRRGTALPRRILNEIHTGTSSIAEPWARRLIHEAALPEPRWNCPVRGPHNDLLAIADAWWDDIGLAWDLAAYQFTPTDHEEAATRIARLTAAGIIVVRTLPTTLRQNPRKVLNDLRHAHLVATHRPRPHVTTDLAHAH